MSFISLKLILPPLHEILVDQGEVIALIKPQSRSRESICRKNGIVRDPAVHQRVLEEILDFAQSNGFNILDLSFSPITGGEGNIEFLVHLQKVQNGDGTRKAEISVLRSLLKHMKPFIIQKLTDFAELVFYMPALSFCLKIG